MISNSNLTIFHKKINKEKLIEEWEKYNFNNCWVFESKNASVDNGYKDSNKIEVRMPYNEEIINIIKIGDIIVPKKINYDIKRQQDLKDVNVYNILTIKSNNFGKNKHIHISGE